ncbi:hypothetical protein [Candidatus Palauibacter sp.]|uniref:hypothetical protein n=1 Tax=Candidatus Palauibacter sp. TaxID=3101350 RepID=UPI003D0F4A4C
MNRISKWFLVLAVTVAVGLVMPNIAEAQDCESCNSITGECEPDRWFGADRCVEGEHDGEPWCASWGGLTCDPRVVFNDVGPDGSVLGGEAFAARELAAAELSSHGPSTQYTRDCGNRIVGRSYVAVEAADMRRKTESIII